MDILILVFVFTTLLREGAPLLTRFIAGPSRLNWNDAKQYCEARNMSLIVLDSQENWDSFTSSDEFKYNSWNEGDFWISFKFDASVKCGSGNKDPWLYDGWARWKNDDDEPNKCPEQRCVRLANSFMRTRECSHIYKPICAIEVNETRTEPVVPATAPTTGVNQDISSIAIGKTTVDLSSATEKTTSAGMESSAPSTSNLTSVMSAGSTSTPELSTDVAPNGLPATPDNIEGGVSSPAPNMFSGTDTSVVPTSNSVLTTSSQITPTVQNGTCVKCCFMSNNTRKLDQHERSQIMRELRALLAVNKSGLSTQNRKLISVYDSRPNSVAMGGLACVILVAVVGVIVVPDIFTLGQFVFRQLKKK